MSKLDNLIEELENAWDDLQMAHLALPGDMASPHEEIDARLNAIEEALRRYENIVLAIEKERKRLRSVADRS